MVWQKCAEPSENLAVSFISLHQLDGIICTVDLGVSVVPGVNNIHQGSGN